MKIHDPHELKFELLMPKLGGAPLKLLKEH